MKKTYLPKTPEAPEANKPRRIFNTVPLEAHLARSSPGFDCVLLEEASLLFAKNRGCVDPRTGIAAYGPYFKTGLAGPHQLRVGVVGTAEGIEQSLRMLNKISRPVEQEKRFDCLLHPSFPGLSTALPFQVEVTANREWCRPVHVRDLIRAMESCDDPAVKSGLLQDCFGREARELAQLESSPDVVICAVTDPLGDLLRPQPLVVDATPARLQSKSGLGASSNVSTKSEIKFQIALDAGSVDSLPILALSERMLFPVPGTDRSTLAWNIALALLRKAGLPCWRLADADNGSCHVGISFFRTPAGLSPGTWAGFACAFAESGESLVVTGNIVARQSIDERAFDLHLDEKQSAALLTQVLMAWKDLFGSLPGKVVLHKLSGYNEAERVGFKSALGKIGKFALTTLTQRGVFLMRPGRSPVLRGSAVPFGEKLGLIYTSGYVPFLQCYPGERLPQPFEIVENWGSIPFLEIAKDLLRLTKMDTSSPRFYSEDPVPYSHFRRVRELLEVPGRKPAIIQGGYGL